MINSGIGDRGSDDAIAAGQSCPRSMIMNSLRPASLTSRLETIGVWMAVDYQPTLSGECAEPFDDM
jgi:hypothetical protein